MPGGPQPITSAHRLRLAQQIAGRLRRHYGERLLALGLYGSLARGTDGPYSDIEMHCVLHGSGIELCHEWSAGPWKAEVDVYSQEVLLAWAGEVDVDWSLTHGSCVHVQVLHDPADFFSRLREIALSQPDEIFQRAILDVIVGELYERVGKVRNAYASGRSACLPYLAVELARFGACLVALEQRHLYTDCFLQESLSLPGRPAGYDALCRLAMAGTLSDAANVAATVDAFWLGVEQWAGERQLCIEGDWPVN